MGNAGRRVLLVEDNYLVGEVVIDILQENGWIGIGPIGSVLEAFDAIDDTAPDCAILDINLHGAKSYPVADALERRGVPFVFLTGYGRDGIDVPYRRFPYLLKPVSSAVLLSALRELLHNTIRRVGDGQINNPYP